MKRLIVLAALVQWAGCGPDQFTGNPYNRDGGPDFANMGVACPKPLPDSDGDTINDTFEGGAESPPRDTDKDGLPDYKDPDSDADGIPDAIEGRNGNTCTPPFDSDSDGTPDFRDLDSDSATNSTLPDREEAGSDPTKPLDTNSDGEYDYMDLDNDGDGIPDQFELTAEGQVVAATTLSAAPDTDVDGYPDVNDTDTDGDGVMDIHEGLVDTDGDLVPNYRDLDSDADCVPDSAEAGDGNPLTPPVDTDLDGAPDFQDRDSDNEGLVDGNEDKNCNGFVDACETDRTIADSDADNVTDLIEYQGCAVKTPAQQASTMCQCDGSNANVNPRTRGDFVFIVDYNMSPVPTQSTLDLDTDVSQADVVVALDTTASMGPCATNLANNLAAMTVPGAKSKVKNLAIGVVTFRDFLDPFVVQYNHRIQTVATTAGIQSVQSTLQGISTGNGFDLPEAGWEALYSIAGGPALSGTGSSTWNSTFNLGATHPVTPTAGETQGTVAGAGFRAGSVPIVLAVGDSNWHDSPGSVVSGEDGIDRYGSGTDCTSGCNGVPSRATTIQRLNAIGAHVIGLAVTGGSGDPKTRFKALAQATQAVVNYADFGVVRPAGCGANQCCTGSGGAGEAPVGASDCPLSYTITRSGSSCPVSDAIVSGIAALANGLKFDIHVEARDVDPMTVDNFIFRLLPNLSGVGPAAMCITMTPSALQDNFTSPKASPGPDGVLDTFPGIGGNNRICFDVIPKTNTTIMNTDAPQIFRAQLQVLGKAGANTVNLGTPREVFFLVPPVIKNGPIN